MGESVGMNRNRQGVCLGASRPPPFRWQRCQSPAASVIRERQSVSVLLVHSPHACSHCSLCLKMLFCFVLFKPRNTWWIKSATESLTSGTRTVTRVKTYWCKNLIEVCLVCHPTVLCTLISTDIFLLEKILGKSQHDGHLKTVKTVLVSKASRDAVYYPCVCKCVQNLLLNSPVLAPYFTLRCLSEIFSDVVCCLECFRILSWAPAVKQCSCHSQPVSFALSALLYTLPWSPVAARCSGASLSPFSAAPGRCPVRGQRQKAQCVLVKWVSANRRVHLFYCYFSKLSFLLVLHCVLKAVFNSTEKYCWYNEFM